MRIIAFSTGYLHSPINTLILVSSHKYSVTSILIDNKTLRLEQADQIKYYAMSMK